MNAPNPREVIGGNFPPIETAIDRAKPIAEELGVFLSDNPVLSNEDEVRSAKELRDRFARALRAVDDERKLKVDPLREQVDAINAVYHKFHNSDRKRPGIWDKLQAQLWKGMSDYALELERLRFEAEQQARREAEEAAEAARAAAEAEAQAREEAASGVCGVDLAGVIEEAKTTSDVAIRADWTARRAERESKVRITGGGGKAVSLKDHETLHVTDWKAAIEEMGLSKGIADEIIKSARAYRKLTDALPTGVEATFNRSL
jgi:hypothetical protein